MIQLTELRKILIPRFDTHGDIILLKGFIDSLLNKFPESEITLFVCEGYDQLAPLFSDRLNWRTQPYSPSRFANDEINGVVDNLRTVATERWDLVLFTTYNRTFFEDLFAAVLSNSYCVTIGRQVQHSEWQKQVFSRFDLPVENLYDQILPLAERLHETEKYQLLWEQLFDAKDKIPLPRIDVPETEKIEAELILQELGMLPGSYVACMPAGVQNITIKQWPEERFAEVLDWLFLNFGMLPLLIGHESEREILEKVISLLKANGVNVHLWLGKQGDMGVLGALLQKAGLYLGNDSAPMHMAAAVGIPTIGIFGGGHWPRFNPVGARTLAVTCCLPCFYCEWQCIFGDAPCVKLVSVDDVKAAVGSMLRGESNVSGAYYATSLLQQNMENMILHVSQKYKLLQDELLRRQNTIDALTYALHEMSVENEQNLSVVTSSLSWRITAPIRKLLDLFWK